MSPQAKCDLCRRRIVWSLETPSGEERRACGIHVQQLRRELEETKTGKVAIKVALPPMERGGR